MKTEKYEMKTNSGYDFFEVSSAFQKSIRRGLEEDAIFWGTELDLSGYGEYAWKRMRVMMSEDIGIAEQNLPANLSGLYATWAQLRKKKDKDHGPERLHFIHAIILLVRAKKSRMIDHATIWAYEGKRDHPEIPDWALDNHTRRGKAKGRGEDFFFQEGTKMENESEIEDPYKDLAIKARSNKIKDSLF